MNHTIWSSLSGRAGRMAVDALAGIETLQAWQAVRASRREELLQGLGLSPLPERCEPKVTEYGGLSGSGFRARKIAYQIAPDCWASACFYYPDPLPPGKAPGILYLCGHAPLGIDHYQSHPIRWARRGYICLIFDTIEQADNPGEHHGFNMGLHEAWLALGYSGAGGEVWNSMCALDVLAADPGVDPERLAATGVSGGGACSFFLAAVDERIKAVSSLCGVSTPKDAVANRHLLGHCDCFYPHNLAGRDWSDYAALIAPRPALFCNADDDPLFHASEVGAFVERTRRVYELHGEADACRLVTCPGPHGDHPEFDEATADWFDRHVAGEERPAQPRGGREFPETVTSVFNGRPPEPDRLHLLPHLLTRRGSLSLPLDAQEWPALRETALEALRALFPQSARDSFQMTREGNWLRTPAGPGAVAFTIDRGELEGVPLWLQSLAPAAATAMLLSVAGEGETMQHAIARASGIADPGTTIYAGLEPRLAGDRSPGTEPGAHLPGSRPVSPRTALLRAMALTGTTPVMLTVHDILAVTGRLLARPETQSVPLYLHGRGAVGVAALYASVLEERIAGVIVEDSPGSHLDGAPILGILRLLDLPQAAGLMAPRPMALVNAASRKWSWPSRLYRRLGHAERHWHAVDARAAFETMRALGNPASPRDQAV